MIDARRGEVYAALYSTFEGRPAAALSVAKIPYTNTIELIDRLNAYIDNRNGLVVVDTPTASRAEDLISQLRATLGTFKATPLEVNESAGAAMTRWLNGAAPLPGGFELPLPFAQGSMQAGILVGILSYIPFTLYRALHQKHHLHLATEKDVAIDALSIPAGYPS